MARESTITFEQVATTADNMKAQNVKPTARNVRDVLGTGSMATVLKFLQLWQSGQIRQSQAIDDTLDPAIARAISNQIASKVQEATADTTARLADLQAETDNVIAENERQAAEIEAQAGELAALQEQHAALVGRAQQIETDSTRTAAELVAERQAAEAARVELAKAELRLEAVPRIEAEIEKVRAELLQARAQSAELHEAAAVACAKLEAEEAKSARYEEHFNAFAKQAEEAGKRAVATAEALGNERVAVQASQARLEAAARELDDARKAVAAAREAAKQAGEEAAELRGQLSAVSISTGKPVGKAKPAAPGASTRRKPQAGKKQG